MYWWNGRTWGTNCVTNYLVQIWPQPGRTLNSDEFGLIYRVQSNKSLHLKNENCVIGKHSKLCLTGLTAANAVGEKLTLFVIGKSKKPWCFKHIKHLPCRYRSQKKSWMDNILFEEWVREVDTCFIPKKDEKLFYWLMEK